MNAIRSLNLLESYDYVNNKAWVPIQVFGIFGFPLVDKVFLCQELIPKIYDKGHDN